MRILKRKETSLMRGWNNDTDVERILNMEGMIRSPRKVRAVINNARCYQKVREEFGSFCKYIWAYSDGKMHFYE